MARSLSFKEWNVQQPQDPGSVEGVRDNLLANRGIAKTAKESFFNAEQEDLPDPRLMKNMDMATKMLDNALRKKDSVLVVGDYDVDGVTSTTIMVSAMKMIFQQVNQEDPNVEHEPKYSQKSADIGYFTPHRVHHGYGLTVDIVEYAKSRDYKVIAALDNGTAAVEAVEKANEIGIQVIVFDHHLPHEKLPDCPVVNPKQEGCSYSFKDLCAGGICFQAAWSLLSRYGMSREAFWKQFGSLAGLATVADMVPLHQENRVLAKRALLQPVDEIPWEGLKHLMAEGGITQDLTSDHFGFQIGPRINAAGRVPDLYAQDLQFNQEAQTGYTNLAVELILNGKTVLASPINDLNDERKKMVTEAIWNDSTLQQVQSQLRDGKKSVVISDKDWHEGVVGLIASHYMQLTGHPTFAFTRSGKYMKASARAPEGIHLKHVLDQASRHLYKYGGHEAAAGMSVPVEHFQHFQSDLERSLRTFLDGKILTPQLLIDQTLKEKPFKSDIIGLSNEFEPCGMGNPRPVFATSEVGFARYESSGVDGKTLQGKIYHESESRHIPFLFFNGEIVGKHLEKCAKDTRFRIAYTLGRGFRGEKQIHLLDVMAQ